MTETKFESGFWSQFNSSTPMYSAATAQTGGPSKPESSTTLNENEAGAAVKTPLLNAATTTETGDETASARLRATKTSAKPSTRSATAQSSNPTEPTPTKTQKTANVRFAFGSGSGGGAGSGSGGALNKSNESHMQENWIECWQTKTADVVVQFEFYLCPILDWTNDKLPSVTHYKSLDSPNFDCETLPPDTIRLKIEIGPSLIMLYGTMLKRLW